MGRARSRFSRLARVRHHPRWAAPTGRPAPYPARPTRPTPPTELTTEPRNRSHTNRIRRHRITSQAAGPTSSQIYTGNGTPPHVVAHSLAHQLPDTGEVARGLAVSELLSSRRGCFERLRVASG